MSQIGKQVSGPHVPKNSQKKISTTNNLQTLEIPPTEICQKESASSNITQASKPPVAVKTKKNSLPSNNIQGYKVHTRNREVFRNIQNQNAFASKSHSISKTAFRGHSSISISKENRAGSGSQLNSFRNMTDDEVMKIKRQILKDCQSIFLTIFSSKNFNVLWTGI